MPLASVLVPVHDHWATLPLAVESALRQTEPDLEVVIIGDGVTTRTREVAAGLVASDPRVLFLDLPKGEHHGECHRDTAVRLAQSPAIFYLCDDDLLLPRHVENLLGLLETADLAQSRNGYVDTDSELVLYPTDLADPRSIAWHLMDPRRNLISLTGTAHRRDAYLSLDKGWTTTPPEEWPDHYLWKKFLRRSDLTARTHPEMTTIQLPTSLGRDAMSQEARGAELVWWANRIRQDDAHGWLQARVVIATARQLDATYREHTLLQFAQEQLVAETVAAREAAAHAQQEVVAARDQVIRAEHATDRAIAAEQEAIATREVARQQLAEVIVAAQEQAARAQAECDRAAEQASSLTTVSNALAEQLDLIRGSRTWRLRERLVRLPGARVLTRRSP